MDELICANFLPKQIKKLNFYNQNYLKLVKREGKMSNINLKLNKIVKYLVYSDLIFYTGWGLVSPIFAIFIIGNIIGGNAFVAGIAAAINLIVRSIVRIPVAMQVDKSKKRAYYFMFFGLLVAALVPLGYIFSKFPWQIYILQAVLGASLSFSTAGWTKIFSEHIDRGKESTQWGVDAVAVGVGSGVAGAIGGAAVTYLSFKFVFAVVAIIGILGAIILLAVRREIMKNNRKDGYTFIRREAERMKKTS